MRKVQVLDYLSLKFKLQKLINACLCTAGVYHSCCSRIVVAGTDRLFDNLYNNDITAVTVVVQAVRAGLGPQFMERKIGALARQQAQDKNRQTPFSAAALAAGSNVMVGSLMTLT